MSEKIRIIPRLEIKNNNVIKGVQFEGLRVVGNPYQLSQKYYKEGADQIIVTDVVASLYSRHNLFNTINKLTDNIFIPITAGGGVRSLDDIKQLLKVGADRVSINSYLFERPEILNEIGNTFGGKFLTVMIEVKKIGNNYFCMKNHGRENSGFIFDKWLNFLSGKNIGELAVYSVDNDGSNKGFDKNLINILNKKKIKKPLIYGGGLSDAKDICDLIKKTTTTGVSISSALHFNLLKIKNLKLDLKDLGININEI
jgi:cyclase